MDQQLIGYFGARHEESYHQAYRETLTQAVASARVDDPEGLDLALEVGEQVDDRDVLWNLGNACLQLGADQAQQQFYGYAPARAREAGFVTTTRRRRNGRGGPPRRGDDPVVPLLSAARCRAGGR